jgi:hypothetical protein
VKFYREWLNEWFFKDEIAWKIWSNIFLSASHKGFKTTCKGSLVTLLPGQVIYGRPEWSSILKIPEGKLRGVIDLLQQDNRISIKTVGRRYSVITIIDWENDQQNDEKSSVGHDIIQNEEKEITNELTNLNASIGKGLNNVDNQQNNQQDSQQKTNRKPNNKNVKNVKNIYTTEFELFYQTYPRPEDKRRTFTNWNTCLKTNTAEHLIAAANNYKNKKAGTDIQYLKSSANFLGKEKPFEDFLVSAAAEVSKEEKPNKNIINVPDFFKKANGYEERIDSNGI